MRTNRRSGRGTLWGLAAVSVCSSLGTVGCVAPSPLAVQVHRYRIDVRLDPVSHELIGRTAMDLARTDDRALPAGRPVAVELLLHPDLKITRVAAGGATVQWRYTRPAPLLARLFGGSDGRTFTPRKHVIVLAKPVDALTLFVDYRGELFQDVAGGEKAGEIHNFSMRAHIGEDGIYLADGNWYPQPAPVEHAEPSLAEFALVVDPVPEFELAAGAQRDPVLSKETGRLAWRSPYPCDGMVLVGGRHQIHHTVHNDVGVNLHLKPGQAKHAEGLFEAVGRYLDRYEPLIGPYPAEQFTIVDNFFSSGFAFPTFTLLSSMVIDMGERSQTAHGYIDHEILHCWWGNGVQVDPRDGNWCEALASYAANYYGYVLDSNEEDARRKRRNYSHFLSRLKPEADKPLGTYGRDNGCSRGIAYNKGAMVLHMLARKIGQDRFWAAMRRFTAEFVGRYASWEDIRRLCEEESGMNLETFFRQWVRSGGAPKLSIEQARYDSAERALILTVSQGETGFELDVPIRVGHAGGALEVKVPVRAATETITIPVPLVPQTVELDPDYHIFRKLSPDEVIPTTGATRHGTTFGSVVPAGAVSEAYTSVRSIFESSFEEDERVALTAGEIEEGALAERCVLILGEAVRDDYVAGFLTAIEFPVHWTADGFAFEGVTYSEPGDAILCTIRHPGVGGGGVTVLYANSEAAIPKAMNVPMYDRSLVVFKNRVPVFRHDFERRRLVPVKS